MIVMKNLNDPDSTLRDHVSKIRDRLRQLGANVGDKQVSEHIREIVSELGYLVKTCELGSRRMGESFEGEIRELRLADEMLEARSALHQAVFENSDDGIIMAHPVFA